MQISRFLNLNGILFSQTKCFNCNGNQSLFSKTKCLPGVRRTDTGTNTGDMDHPMEETQV